MLTPGGSGATGGGSSSNTVPTSSSSSSLLNPLLAAQDSNPVYIALVSNQPLGGLHLLSKVISTAFEHAHEYMDKQQIFSSRMGGSGVPGVGLSSGGSTLPMMSFLGFYLLPEINKLVAIYMEEFIREITTQVRQESWQMIRASKMTVRDLTIREVTYDDSAVSSSYLWMVHAMNHLLDEIAVILDGDSNSSVRYYQRTDLCEVRRALISAVMFYLY